ncbi:methylated-DNA--[protein]-cysteine S-methyltransferase [Candidatus Halobonum tyrrellensis]|uniref:methylated-DNA--[protein]-cysteine S-methyltransferase n=1 Tax=Candidatus Halobonum tyrrellensis TaxID=1431545 RepID=UPI001F3BB72D|nr:methylated-DNA--[protein]-cysteine S-methyltransferase [Candidatus Halobonum tyrrellensis]
MLDAPREHAARQAAEYADGDRRAFDLRVRFPDGFTGEVMRAMAAIPYGETRTYGDLAAALDSSAVAVGGACGRNPLPLVVPCHRVVGADSLGGFSADGGVRLKRALLAHERATPAAPGTRGARQSTLDGFADAE